MKKRISVPLLFLFVVSMLSATNCVTVKQQQITKEQRLSDREKIVSKALEIEGLKPKPVYRQRITLKHPLTGEDVEHTMDCSGFVLAVYKSANIGGFETLASNIEGENGVKIIYNTLEKSRKIYRKKIPKIADIVFFDNTYDRNKNGAVNDKLTHVGIVLAVNKKTGTITFIHSSTSDGVTEGYANLYHPNQEKLNGETINSSLRIQKETDPPDTKYYAGALIHAFGTVFEVPQEEEDL